jgi:hypothetical protein
MLYDMKILSPYPDPNKLDIPGLKYDEKSSSFKRIQFNNYPIDYYTGRMINFENNQYKNMMKQVEFTPEGSINEESDSSSI